MSSDLVAFIKARLDEDEQAARAVGDNRFNWETRSDCVVVGSSNEPVAVGAWNCDIDEDDAAHIARHDPARVLREVEAKRKIIGSVFEVEAVTGWPGCGHSESDREQGLCDQSTDELLVLRALALCWSDHPDYRPEWRPV